VAMVARGGSLDIDRPLRSGRGLPLPETHQAAA